MLTWHWDKGTWQISLWLPKETPIWPVEASKLHFSSYRPNIQHLLWHFDLFSFMCSISQKTLPCVEFKFIVIQYYVFTLKNSPRDVISEISSMTGRAQMTRQSSTYGGWWSPEAPKVLLYNLFWMSVGSAMTVCSIRATQSTVQVLSDTFEQNEIENSGRKTLRH